MMGRYVLPWFGGGPAVWTNCMLFFQAMLLAGYGYAHWLGSRRSQRMQAWVHVALLAASLRVPAHRAARRSLEIHRGRRSIRANFALAGRDHRGALLLLSATTPLLQRWFHVTHPEQSPWRLYALSNLGSFLALFSYPLVLEPYFRLSTQSGVWSGLYVVFIGLCGWIAWQMRSVPVAEPEAATRGRRRAFGDRYRDVARACRLRLGVAAGDYQPDHAGDRGLPISMGRAAFDLSADVHSHF